MARQQFVIWVGQSWNKKRWLKYCLKKNAATSSFFCFVSFVNWKDSLCGLFRHSVKNLSAQEERLATSPYSVTRLHLPHAIAVKLTLLSSHRKPGDFLPRQVVFWSPTINLSKGESCTTQILLLIYTLDYFGNLREKQPSHRSKTTSTWFLSHAIPIQQLLFEKSHIYNVCLVITTLSTLRLNFISLTKRLPLRCFDCFGASSATQGTTFIAFI